MSDMPTSPVSTPLGPPDTMLGEWRRTGAFLRRPRLEDNPKPSAPLPLLARVYALDMAIMGVLITVAVGLIALGVELPSTAIANMEITIGVAALVIVVAPVLEEIAFRSWLSGRLGHWIGLLLLAIGAAGWMLVTIGQKSDAIALSILGLAIGVASPILAVIAFVRGSKASPMRWFVSTFPIFFWLSASAFALIHVANFDEPNWWVVVPLVLPQLILGSLAGYVRVQIGLWAAIALHAMHNASALGLAMLAMSAS